MSIFASGGNAPWQTEFEKEEINGLRWSCLVSAIVESEPSDEECLKILNQHVTTGEIPLVRTISMGDVIALFKTPADGKKKEEGKAKEKLKMENANDPSLRFPPPPPPRYPEIVPFLSKYAVISDGLCKLNPALMAYAIKYLILNLKDQDYHRRRVGRKIRQLTEEAAVKAEVIETLKGCPRKRVIQKNEETPNLWGREMFDIFSDPCKDGPFHAPELYVVLHDFYDPFVFAELLKLKVPFRAVTKIENFQGGKPVSGAALKKSEMINNFWKLLEGNVSNDIALLKYVAPNFDGKSAAEMSSQIAIGLTAILYSIFNLHRLHQTYIQQMKVHRMIESLESLNLSKCLVYNKLCDALITEDPNAEIFVLFSMIEQVVAGVPETENRVLVYEKKPSIDFFEPNEDLACLETPILEQYYELGKSHTEKGITGRSGGIFFHDDKISLGTISVDSNIIKSNEIFDRFVINSISSKIRNKFLKLTPALKAQNDFSFYQIWHNSKENKDNFRVKFFFLIVMKLIERINIFDVGCVNGSSHCESLQSANENSISSGDDGSIQNEPQEFLLSDVENLFYQQFPKEKETIETSSAATKEVRKVNAISVLDGESSSLSFENEEIACGRCPKLTVCENPTSCQVHLQKLEKFLESYEISHLNDPNFLANREKCDAFVEKHNFYETFEPNRTVQRLQELFDEYNTVEYTYYSPTDTLFVLGHDDSDFRGVYHSPDSGFINSPLFLRDFVRYFLPDNKRWMANVNEKYIEFLKGVKMRRSNEEKRRNHEFRCGLLKMYTGMTDPERRKFLYDTPTEGKVSALDSKKGAKERGTEATTIDLEDLPEKERQRQPDVEFLGVNCGGTRTQVNVVNYEFHSEDGSLVGVKTQSWLNSESIVTFTARRHDCRLFVHRWSGEKEKRMMLFREPSGVLVTFGLNSRPFPVKITQPNGLLIEIGNGTSYIKQTYLEPYKWGEDIAKEKSRCYLRDGSVLIFCVDGTIQVLYPSGTKHSCYRLSPKGEVEIYETLTPTGELWVRDDCSKCKRLGNTMNVWVGADSEMEETYYKREDGTSCMLWPNGKLVTTYPEGTKITTTPKFEEELLFIEAEDGNNTTSITTGSHSTIGGNSLEEVSNGFTVVTCSHLIEHPKYATFYNEQSKQEVRILEKMKAEINSEDSIRIECRNSVLKASTENAEFYTVCRHCTKKSISKIFLNSENLLSKSKDHEGKRFYVYNSGQVLHEPGNEINNDSKESLTKTEENPFSVKPSGQFECHKTCRSKQRCLIVERDLTGMEFIHDYNLQCYQGSLSQDAYYHLGNLSVDKTHIQHGFFEPIYKIGREKYIMKYEKDDGVPTRLTRKNLKDGSAINPKADPVRRRERRELPKAVVVRFIRVLLPDPMTVMKEITKEISIYRRRSLNLSKNYGQLSKKVKGSSFTKYIAKELELISSTLCPSLRLYQHTSSLVPYTEKDIHSAAHSFDRSNYFVESNPADCRAEILPRCKRIPKPLKHSGKDTDIPEVTGLDDNPDEP